MGKYLQLTFSKLTTDQSDLLVAALSEAGFDGFEQEEETLKAFVPAAAFNEEAVKAIAADTGSSYAQSTIEETNWNAVWESNFAPVIVDDFVGIRAHFHEPIVEVVQEIVITPKMSFGTGHHATTHLVIQQMRNIDFANKQVFDFGTGTGVLAILAEKLGASKILAIDNDDWSIENAAENAERNSCTKIVLQKAFDASGAERYDVILANINKNVILDNLKFLSTQLVPGGILLLSGLLIADEADIKDAASVFQLIHQQTEVRNGWICMQFIK
jgi:ribosomal protein L11 methyltransferase